MITSKPSIQIFKKFWSIDSLARDSLIIQKEKSQPLNRKLTKRIINYPSMKKYKKKNLQT